MRNAMLRIRLLRLQLVDIELVIDPDRHGHRRLAVPLQRGARWRALSSRLALALAGACMAMAVLASSSIAVMGNAIRRMVQPFKPVARQ
jgi:hypothetical protein